MRLRDLPQLFLATGRPLVSGMCGRLPGLRSQGPCTVLHRPRVPASSFRPSRLSPWLTSWQRWLQYRDTYRRVRLQPLQHPPQVPDMAATSAWSRTRLLLPPHRLLGCSSRTLTPPMRMPTLLARPLLFSTRIPAPLCARQPRPSGAVSIQARKPLPVHPYQRRHSPAQLHLVRRAQILAQPVCGRRTRPLAISGAVKYTRPQRPASRMTRPVPLSGPSGTAPRCRLAPRQARPAPSLLGTR